MSKTLECENTKALQGNLEQLAAAANKSHRACVDAQRSAVMHAKDAGDALLTAKAEIGHGEWTAWVNNNCVFGNRSAQNYMMIARKWDELQAKAGAKTQRASLLTVREALRILSDSKSMLDFGEDTFRRSCPSCGAMLCVTSRRWQTCVHCWACRLYPRDESKSWKSATRHWDSTSSVVGISEAFDEMDRAEKRAFVKSLAKKVGMTARVNKQ